MIRDCEVANADTEQLIEQYKNLVLKQANRYDFVLRTTGAIDKEDLIQAGKLAIVYAQRHYNSEAGLSFMSYAYLWIKSIIRRTIGIDNDGNLPEELLSLDVPLNENQPDGETLIDSIPDDSLRDNDEKLVKEEERSEQRIELEKAIQRLPQEKYKTAITRYYFDEKTIRDIAKELKLTDSQTQGVKSRAISHLRADYHLKKVFSPVHVGLQTFKRTHTSEVEKEILWKEKIFEDQFGEGSYLFV